MFAASKAFFQRAARATIRNSASKMTMATAAPKSYSASAVCAVRYIISLNYRLGCRRSYVGFIRWLPNIQDCAR